MHRLSGRVILCLDPLILVDINELVLIIILRLLYNALFHIFAVSWIIFTQMQQITTRKTLSRGQVVLIK